MIDRAYELAHFILRRPDLALCAAEEALAQLEVAMATQDKRLYYEPGRDRHSKVRLGEGHQLQRLVYVACEPHERVRELRGGASYEDQVISFTKHLVRITIRRNSFHVLVGVCRLLFNYSTAEAMDLHNQLLDEPDDVKDESYYRARKAILLRELCQRFGGTIGVVRQHRGEERLEPIADSGPHRELVGECLERFSPWDVLCAAATSTAAADPEIRRIHDILHPPCLERLATALTLVSPPSRLELPRFRSATEGKEDDMPHDRRRPPPLTPPERERIARLLEGQSNARARAPAQTLRILVDGREQGRLDPIDADRISMALPEGAELIEVRAGEPGRDLLLATALLSGEEDAARPLSITLEGGQQLTVDLAAAERSQRFTVAYRETRPWRALRLALRRAGRWLAVSLAHRPAWRAATATLALVLVGSLTLIMAPERRAPAPAPPVHQPAPAHPLPAAGVRGSAPPPGERVVETLGEVRAVFIEAKGNDRAVAEGLGRRLARGLAARFALVGAPHGADAVLKIEGIAEPGLRRPADLAAVRVRILARLVNVEGTILWPSGLERGGRVIDGVAADAGADQVAAELTAALRR